MDIATQARINDLLLEREELLLRIHKLETRATELLGEAYPFERPVLPSDAKPRRKPAGAKGKSAAAVVSAAGAIVASGASPGSSPAGGAPVHFVLRELAGPEDAWRVVYEQYGQRHEESHRDRRALDHLLACQCATLRVLSVD